VRTDSCATLGVLVEGKATRLGLVAANKSTWEGSMPEKGGSKASGSGTGDSSNPGREGASSADAEGRKSGRLERLS
jgi:hypothetical protein